MSEVREAMERLGARFDPPEDGLDDLSRRRKRARLRRRVTTGTLALTVAAGGALLAVRAFPASTHRHPGKPRIIATWAGASATPTAAASVEPTCPSPSGDSPAPVVLSSTSGPAGSSVEVTGVFGSSELWMQLLWNAGEISDRIAPPPWPATGPDLSLAPAGPGPVVKLAAIAGPATTGDCSFATRFTVPDVGPGIYQLRWFFGGLGVPAESGGFYIYALAGNSLTFQVTG
jgi:hypothetical protein